MIKIYSIEKSNTPSVEWVKRILEDEYSIPQPQIVRNEHGKPYMLSKQVHFSVTHTKERLFIAFSSKNIGLDAESLDRKVNYSSILQSYFSEIEGSEIANTQDFLRHWVAKESFIKYMGSTIAHDFKKINYIDGRLTYCGSPTKAHLQFLQIEEYLLAVCSEENADVQIIFL